MKRLWSIDTEEGRWPTCTVQRKAGPLAGKLDGTGVAAELEELLRVTKNASNMGERCPGRKAGIAGLQGGDRTRKAVEGKDPGAQGPGNSEEGMQTSGCHIPAGQIQRELCM